MRGRGRGRGGARAASSVGPEDGASENDGSAAGAEGEPQLFTGDETHLPVPSGVSDVNQSMADLPDVEEF